MIYNYCSVSMASHLTAVPAKTIRNNCANENINAILSEGVWIIEIASLFEYFSCEKYSFNYNYTASIRELEKELQDQTLLKDSLIKVVRDDSQNIKYFPIVDWNYIEDSIEKDYQVATVLNILNEMKFHNKV